jgi:hypothetical protein
MRAIDTAGMAVPQQRDPGPEPTLCMLPIAQLVVDAEYQRPIGKDGRRAIERIAAKFEWTKFSTVVVAPVSGNRYAIIDGQHRTTAAALIGIRQVPCQIVALDRAGQAAAFSAINGSVTKVTPWNIYKAAMAAGEAWAISAMRVCEAAGCKLMTNNATASTKQGGELYGVFTIRDLIAKHGEHVVQTALSAYRKGEYGELAIAWTNTFIVAWVEAVAQCKDAVALGADQLARFHDKFDVLEQDDVVTTRLKMQKREGKPTPAHWDALSTAILDALQTFAQRRAA